MGRSPKGGCDAERARSFARDVVIRLRGAGHEALFAGGCVRDELLSRTPTDYDVATSARPDAVRDLFGKRRTIAVGAAFGVITVIGPADAGQVEVATFRTDAEYTDGRHPAGVTFSTARDDALRRDFTINGMFLDPLGGEIHDYVGGRDDLTRGVVRAIGSPGLRFAEDHLRMLRAVRFTAQFDFILDGDTRAAIERMAGLVSTVSPERVAEELRRMVAGPGGRKALELLAETGLAPHVLGEFPTDSIVAAAAVVGAMDEPCLSAALAAGAAGADPHAAPDLVERAATRLRLSHKESDRARWLVDGMATTSAVGDRPADLPWSRMQPWVAHADASILADLWRAQAAVGRGSAAGARWFSDQVVRPRHEIDPPAWLSGADLLAAGVAPGPRMGALLAELRRRQLDGELVSREAALAWARSQAS